MRILTSVIVLLLLTGCSGLNGIKQAFYRTSPYEEYTKSLEKADLTKTALAKRWLQAGNNALQDSLQINTPYQEKGYFSASSPDAKSYQLKAKEGQVINVQCNVSTQKPGSLFIDLFQLKSQEWTRVAHADSTHKISYEINSTGKYLIRVQPELLIDLFYDLKISFHPALKMPVAGASNSSIGSIYGDPRDGGNRSHEGIDIFAQANTPVIAPANGFITRVGLNGLGGKVVWLRDSKRNLSYYFAHLNQQLVSSAQKINIGDTIGLVGNTGNAKYTPPHLHFGIYKNGSRDPLPYVKTASAQIKSFNIDTSRFLSPSKLTVAKGNIRLSPSTKSKIISQITENTFLQITGQTNDWYLITLPNHLKGYIYKNLLNPLGDGHRIKLDEANMLLSGIQEDAVPIRYIEANEHIDILAEYQNFKYVKTMSGQTGWLIIS